MSAVRRLLDRLQARQPDDRELLVEYVVIIGLMVLVVVLAFVLLGDAISDFIAQVAGTVDEVTDVP